MSVQEQAFVSIILKVITNNIARKGCGVCCSKFIHTSEWVCYKPGLVSLLTNLMCRQRLEHNTNPPWRVEISEGEKGKHGNNLSEDSL